MGAAAALAFGLALIRLRRQPSQQIDNRLRGKVWVDSVRMEPVSP